MFYHNSRLLDLQRRRKRLVRPVFLFLLIIVLTLFFIIEGTGFAPIKGKRDAAKGDAHEKECMASLSGNGVTGVADTEYTDLSPHAVVIKGSINRGESIYQRLNREGISDGTIQLIVAGLAPIFRFRSQSKPGDAFSLSLTPDGAIERFEYHTGPLEKYCLARDANQSLNAWQEYCRLEKYWIRIAGEVKGSLFSTLTENGYPAHLAMQFAEALEWKVDFQHEVRDGDRFSMVVEGFSKGEEDVGYGRIVAILYDGSAAGTVHGYYFDEGEGRGGYFDREGISLKRAFLRAPLSYKYISSGFTYTRRHPILGYVRPHLAIDFAAPHGSPVWAVADGYVLSKISDRYNGNQVQLRHMNGYITYYNHLSRFAAGIKKGMRVDQKQTIGYVGTTGLSTGPHLDYRVKKDGQFINPLTYRYPTGTPLEKAHFGEFTQRIAALDPLLMEEGGPGKILVAEVDSSEISYPRL